MLPFALESKCWNPLLSTCDWGAPRPWDTHGWEGPRGQGFPRNASIHGATRTAVTIVTTLQQAQAKQTGNISHRRSSAGTARVELQEDGAAFP